MPDGTVAFEFASKKAAQPEAAIADFKIDGEDYFIRALADSQVAYLVHRTKTAGPDGIISAVLDFTHKALLPESAIRFEERALRVPDSLSLEQIVKVFEHVLGVVAAFPTGSPAPSVSPRRKTGSPSRANSRLKGVPAP